MMRSINYILIAFTILLHGCNLTDYVDTGDTATERRTFPEEICSLEVNGLFSITLIQDSACFVDIIGPNNLLHLIDIDFQNSKLILNNNIKARYLSGYERIALEIHLPNISLIDIKYPSSIETNGTFVAQNLQITYEALYADCNLNIDVQELNITTNMRGYATLRLEGKANIFNLSVYRVNSVWADNLEVNQCHVIHNGMDDISLNVTSELNAEIGFTGNIFLKGNPSINKTGNGSGQILPID